MVEKKKKTRSTSSSVDPATQYARDVDSGKEIAGPDIRNSCKRHLKDLESCHARGLVWDVAAAQRAIDFFAKVLKLNGGEHEGKPFNLLPWQCFIVGSIFGWKNSDDYRRYRMAYVESGIRDLIAPGTTASNTIYWVQQTGFTNNAAAVAENTTKPYSNIEFAEKITPVRTIAHLFKASKQILDDFSQLQSQVDAEMRFGLKYVEEQEILFGDGTGAHLEGIIPQASAFAAAFQVENQNGIDDLRLAMLQAQLARFPASGHVLHFIDWAKIELTKDTLGRYILANPAALTGPTLWGLPVVATEATAFQGKFLTGAFSAGAQIFDREETNVVISTENADDFEKNMITIRCEERLALAVKRPEAFVYGSFTVPASGGQ